MGKRTGKQAQMHRDRICGRLDGDGPSKYPYVLLLPQDETERILRGRLASLGGRVHRSVTAAEATRASDSARLKLATPLAEVEISAKYVIAADGMHSIIREAAGASFEGGTYDESFITGRRPRGVGVPEQGGQLVLLS
jgi:2-polyprenyl-6-methoxyphenol hydroxylase-like FAD-dependent oxidoreductase